MSETQLADVATITNTINQGDKLLLIRDGDVLAGSAKELDSINQVQAIAITTETTIELNILNGMNSNFLIDLTAATASLIDFTFAEPLNAGKKTARRLYFRIRPHASNDIDIRFPSGSPTDIKFLTPTFTSRKTVTGGTGGASQVHWDMMLEGGWSIGRIATLA